jgi:hypothetical protein
MTLREDINRVLEDGKEYDVRSMLKKFRSNNEVWTHKSPKNSVRCCFLRMIHRKEVIQIKDRMPMVIRRINNGN